MLAYGAYLSSAMLAMAAAANEKSLEDHTRYIRSAFGWGLESAAIKKKGEKGFSDL
jgi:3-methyladenine DNA glycosylase AlkD